MLLKRVFIISLFFVVSLYSRTINIAVATNATFPIKVLKKEFEKLNPETNVDITFGSSGRLTAQIIGGAPFGLFLSANMTYPEDLYSYGIAISKPLVYAQGALVYFSVKKTDFSDSMDILKRDEIKKIAIANPVTAPYGKAAFEAIKNANVLDDVMDKFIYAKSISETIFNAINRADVGIIAKSSVFSPRMSKYKKNINWVDVDTKLYTQINQGMVILKSAKGDKEVKAFYDFIVSEKGTSIFKNYGYFVGK